MATKKNMAVIIATIKSIYPYYAKDANIEVLAKTWLLLLQEYDDKTINNALMLCMKECETPPTPAHIIKKIEDMQPKAYPTELWSQFVETLRLVYEQQEKFGYTFRHEDGETSGDKARKRARELYANMPNELKLYVGSYGEMLRMARQMDEESLKFEKNRFLKMLGDIREENKLRLSAHAQNAIPTDQTIKIENISK